MWKTELYSSNKLLEFSSMYSFLIKYAIWISKILPEPLLCWYAMSGANFLDISRKGRDRSDLFPDFCGDVLYVVPSTHVDKFILLQSGSAIVSRFSISGYMSVWQSISQSLLNLEHYTIRYHYIIPKWANGILRYLTCSYQNTWW